LLAPSKIPTGCPAFVFRKISRKEMKKNRTKLKHIKKQCTKVGRKLQDANKHIHQLQEDNKNNERQLGHSRQLCKKVESKLRDAKKNERQLKAANKHMAKQLAKLRSKH